jgi:ABC-type transport system involved in multi-copper enzyme maturation permease subunit
VSARGKYALGTPLYIAAVLGFFRVLGVSWESIWEFVLVTTLALGVFGLAFVTLVALIEGVVSLNEKRWDR